MNKVILMGRLVADPETRSTPSNTSISRFRLAVNRGGKPVEGQPTADFFDIVTWQKTADFVSKYFKKGMQVALEGRLRNDQWTDKEGQKRFRTEVTADQVYFAEGRRDSHGSEPAPHDPPVGQDGVGGQGYYQQPENAPEPWEQQAQQQRQAPPQNQQQAPQGQYQQDPQQYRQQYQQQQQAPGFGPPAGQQPRKPWET